MIPLAVPNLAGNEARYLQECVDSTFVSSVGRFVDRFETEIAAAAGTREAVCTSNGTCGLHLALTSVGADRDDLVILPTYTFIASANAVAHCGGLPWLMDVTEESWTLDPARLKAALARDCVLDGGICRHRPTGRRVAAVMPVHGLGHPCDMDAIVALARAYGLPVVADGAAALGARYRGRPVGDLGADLTVFSFNGNKTITSGGGGAVAGDDPELLAHARHLSTTARNGPGYTHDAVGFNYRMTNLEAAVGCAQIEQLANFVDRKRALRRRYDEAFADLPGVGRFPQASWAETADWLSGITLDLTRFPNPDGVRTDLRERGIDARPFWKPVHLQPAFAAAVCEPVPVAGALWASVLPLPCSTGLSDAEQEEVIRQVREVLAR